MSDAQPRTPGELFDELHDVFESGDLDRLGELYADDAVREFPFAPEGRPDRIEGLTNIKEHLSMAKNMPIEWTKQHNQVVYETQDPEVLIAEFTNEIKLKGIEETVTRPYIVLLRVRDGKIVLYRDYANPLLPAPIAAKLAEMTSAKD